MKNNHSRSARVLAIGAFVASLLAGTPSRAQDIEVFSGTNPTVTTIPNVLIIIDNTSNWASTVGGVAAWDPELTALANTVQALVLNGLGDKVRVGMMMFAPGGVGLGGSYGTGSGGGGYVRYSIRQMTAPNAEQFVGLSLGVHNRMKTLANAQSIEGSNNAAYAQTMSEAYYYFFGKKPRVGFGDDKRDCGVANTNAIIPGFYDLTTPKRPIYAYGPDDGASGNGNCGKGNPSNKSQFTSYNQNAEVNYTPPPEVDAACQRNFIIFISNGPVDSSDNGPGYSLLQAAVSAEGAPSKYTQVIPWSPNGETAASFADEWARFLYEVKNVATYTINANDKRTGQALNHAALMRSMAVNGGGDACDASDPAEIQACLNAAFNKILSVNSVFASVTLPVSVNPQLQNLDQVYMGMFRPADGGKPRWFGNLKQYKLAVDGGNNLFLADASGSQAIDPSTGQVYETVTSYWTSSSNYWAFSPRGATNPSSDAPDGRLVEKGGAAQRQRTVYALASQSIANRKVFTCVGCSGETTLSGGLDGNNGNTSFSFANALSFAPKLRVPTQAAAESLIRWVRGENTEFEKTDGDQREARPSIHGDVLHSRPTVLTISDTNIYLFYGSNDGMIHAIKGGRGSDGGNEAWSFLPEEFFPRLERLYDNAPVTWSFDTISTSVSLTSGSNVATVGSTTGVLVGMYLQGTAEVPKHTFVTAVNPASGTVNLSQAATAAFSGTARFVPEAKPAFADGPLNVYEDPTNNKKYLFAAFRRGGRFLYAFDITNPDVPKFLWRKGCDHAGIATTNGYGCDSGYDELGQTWSEPRAARVGNSAVSGGRTVLIFGAGYDPTVEDPDPTSDSGRTMGRGLFVVDAYTGNMIKHFRPTDMDYAVPSDITLIDFDRNGFVDRLYFGDTGGQVWSVDTNANKDPDSWNIQRIASFGAAESGSAASRRKFLYPPDVVETAPGSGVYAILVASGDRENPLNGDSSRSSATTVVNRMYSFLDGAPRGTTVVREGNLNDRTSSFTDVTGKLGWFVTLQKAGEKATGSVITLGGTAYFGTNYPVPPAPGACSTDLGNARFYTLDFLTAGGRGGGVSNPSSDITANRFTEIVGGGLPPSPVGTLISAGSNQFMEGVIMGTRVLPVGPAKVGDRFRNFWFKKFDKK